MGRAKLSMKLIPKEKTRIATFKKRKQGLIRKMHEFTTLCDVSACMIIYGPKQETGITEPEIWPENRDEALRIIDVYKSRNKDSGHKTYGLSDFFNDRKRRIEDELAKLRKKNMESKYPTCLESMNFVTEAGLRDFAARLNNKAGYVRSRIQLLRQNKQGLMDYYYYYNPHARLAEHQSHVKMEVLNQTHVPNNIHYPTIDHHQELHSLDQNPMTMMLLMNGNYNDYHNYQPQVFHEPMAGWAGVVDPSMICQSSGLLARYYGPTAPVPFPVPWENNHDGGDQEGVGGAQYQMNFDNIGRYYG